jgi:hypothetical protein
MDGCLKEDEEEEDGCEEYNLVCFELMILFNLLLWHNGLLLSLLFLNACNMLEKPLQQSCGVVPKSVDCLDCLDNVDSVDRVDICLSLLQNCACACASDCACDCDCACDRMAVNKLRSPIGFPKCAISKRKKKCSKNASRIRFPLRTHHTSPPPPLQPPSSLLSDKARLL